MRKTILALAALLLLGTACGPAVTPTGPATTGEVLFVDGGVNVLAIAAPPEEHDGV